jgi:8-oxo-dGTP pyrophosphatase MutT (NUDIX family)
LTVDLIRPPADYTAGMEDPRIADLRRRLAERVVWQAPRESGQIEAAVTAVLRAGESLELLLIERVERAEDPWSGHMALPGGRRDAEDRDLLATALRETAEEVGIVLDPGVELLGALDEVYPQTRLLPPLVIAPFVAAVGLDVEPRADPAEVAAALWVPVDELRHEGALSEVRLERDGERLTFPSFRYRGREVWGLTHRILLQLFALLPES